MTCPTTRRIAVALMLATSATTGLAQHLLPAGSVGLKALPDQRGFFDLPLGEHWTVGSWRPFAPTGTGEGLKIDVGGSYGWNLDRSNRVAVGAGVGLGDDTGRTVLTDGRVRLPDLAAASNTWAPRDLGLNLSWAWRYSQSLAVTSGLGVRYNLTDFGSPALGSAAKPSSAAGYVGLRLKF